MHQLLLSETGSAASSLLQQLSPGKEHLNCSFTCWHAYPCIFVLPLQGELFTEVCAAGGDLLVGKRQDPISRKRASRAGPFYVALENECEGKENKPMLQIQALEGSRKGLENN